MSLYCIFRSQQRNRKINQSTFFNIFLLRKATLRYALLANARAHLRKKNVGTNNQRKKERSIKQHFSTFFNHINQSTINAKQCYATICLLTRPTLENNIFLSINQINKDISSLLFIVKIFSLYYIDTFNHLFQMRSSNDETVNCHIFVTFHCILNSV
jgi:hypothetical protein